MYAIFTWTTLSLHIAHVSWSCGMGMSVLCLEENCEQFCWV